MSPGDQALDVSHVVFSANSATAAHAEAVQAAHDQGVSRNAPKGATSPREGTHAVTTATTTAPVAVVEAPAPAPDLESHRAEHERGAATEPANPDPGASPSSSQEGGAPSAPPVSPGPDIPRSVATLGGVVATPSGAETSTGREARWVRRIRGRLSRLGSSAPQVPPLLEPIISVLKTLHPGEDYAVLLRAFDVAERSHREQRRKNGDPYITHPVAVTTILAELGYLPDTLAAALLHDVVEDTEYSLEQIEHDFGPAIALLVDGVTKLDKVKYGDNAQAETIRKMMIAMNQDLRVLVIKLADRLHNARTWKYVSAESAKRKARETLEIYAPLAHRLGLNKVKWELENRSFQVLHPGRYDEIEKLVAEKTPERERYLDRVRDELSRLLTHENMKFYITGRPKHFYSIYQKMVVDGKNFDEVYDLVGLRILVDTVADCYQAMGVVHAIYNPILGRFKDYISVPKLSIYRSLHTTVVGPEGRTIEVQIRTHEMHREAEYGVAAHWRYKADKGKAPRASNPEEGTRQWMRALMEWQRETVDSNEFIENFRYEAASDEIYVYTPKGKCLALVSGSTPIDFAYAVHTDVGHRTIGAKVNGRIAPLETRLSNGDQVEILTSKSEDAGPRQSWMSVVASSRAKSKIRQWFSKERREESIEKGKDQLSRHMRKQSLPLRRLMAGDSLKQIAGDLKFKNLDDLLYAIGEGHVSPEAVTKRLIELHGGVDGASEDLAEATIPGVGQITKKFRRTGEPQINVEGISDILVKLAKCCTPVPGDPITGFTTRGQGISIHHSECSNLAILPEGSRDRLVKVSWGRNSDAVYEVQIQVEALDRHGLMADITRQLSDLHVNILSANVLTTRDQVAVSRFIFEMASTQHLQHVLSALMRVKGVYDVHRVKGNNRKFQRETGGH
ncbi:RelA/SpoT family protein [Micrococcales bacterium 31B]|nr:RelA/SpoT family protein [Micrococcales bacterium 31B]